MKYGIFNTLFPLLQLPLKIQNHYICLSFANFQARPYFFVLFFLNHAWSVLTFLQTILQHCTYQFASLCSEHQQVHCDFLCPLGAVVPLLGTHNTWWLLVFLHWSLFYPLLMDSCSPSHNRCNNFSSDPLYKIFTSSAAPVPFSFKISAFNDPRSPRTT